MNREEQIPLTQALLLSHAFPCHSISHPDTRSGRFADLVRGSCRLQRTSVSQLSLEDPRHAGIQTPRRFGYGWKCFQHCNNVNNGHQLTTLPGNDTQVGGTVNCTRARDPHGLNTTNGLPFAGMSDKPYKNKMYDRNSLGKGIFDLRWCFSKSVVNFLSQLASSHKIPNTEAETHDKAGEDSSEWRITETRKTDARADRKEMRVSSSILMVFSQEESASGHSHSA